MDNIINEGNKLKIIKEKYILYIGWEGNGNIGDDLVFEIFKLLLNKRMRLCHCNFSYVIDTVNTYKADRVEKYDIVILGGGSLFSMPKYIDICIEAINSGVKVLTWGTGIDMRYAQKTNIVMQNFTSGKRSLGMNDLVTNYNYIKKMIDQAHKIAARGEITRYILDNLKDDLKIEVIGDPGIVISKLIDDKNTRMDSVEKSTKNKLIGLNWGTTNNLLLGMNERELLLQVSVTVNLLTAMDYKIVLFAMCEEDIISCKFLYDFLGNKKVMLIKKVLKVRNMVQLFSCFKFSINLKLHANIISMSVGRPFVCLAYGLKCFDFVDSISLNELILSTEDVLSSNIMECVRYIEKNYNILCSRIIEKIDLYYQKHIAYMDEIIRELI